MTTKKIDCGSGSKIDAEAFFKRLGLTLADERPIMLAWRSANSLWRQRQRERVQFHRQRIDSHLRRYQHRARMVAGFSRAPGVRRAVWCVELRRSFPSMSEAAAFIGRHASNISQSLARGVRCGTYHWEIYDPRRHG
jgi:hypothetical protein